MPRTILPAASRGHVLAAKAMGATMWCWILWRLRHDWKDLVVCVHNGVFGEYNEGLQCCMCVVYHMLTRARFPLTIFPPKKSLVANVCSYISTSIQLQIHS